MTMTTSTDTTSTDTQTSTEVVWRCVQAGIWVAGGCDGRPLAIVSERWRHGFVVTAANGRDLGTFTDLRQAQAVVDSFVTE